MDDIEAKKGVYYSFPRKKMLLLAHPSTQVSEWTPAASVPACLHKKSLSYMIFYRT